jgi:peptidoglycan biosynthesis protein MviN/MurJ (putative lipid II flippase)
MAQISDLELTTGVAIVSIAIPLFTGFLPGLSEVLGDNCSDDMQSNLDFGRATATVSTLSVGVVLSLFTKSIMPTLFAFGISFMLWGAYEIAYRRV